MSNLELQYHIKKILIARGQWHGKKKAHIEANIRDMEKRGH